MTLKQTADFLACAGRRLCDFAGRRVAAADRPFESGRSDTGPRRLSIGKTYTHAPVAVLCSLLGGVGPVLAIGFALAAAVSAQQASYTGSPATGALSFVRMVNLRQQALARPLRSFGPATVEKVEPVPPRLTPSGGRFPSNSSGSAAGGPALPRMLGAVSTVSSTRALDFTPPSGVTGFNALSHLEERLASGGNQFSIEPPSPSVAVGNGYLLEGVNNAVQVYDLSGSSALPVALASNQVFGLPPAIDRTTLTYGVYLTDMRVYFDQGMSRWFIIQRAQDRNPYGTYLNSSHLYMAVSQTADPTANYMIYVMDTTNSGRFGCPCIADYPQIGSDQYGVYVAWNEFTYSAASGYYTFVDAALLALSKSSLLAGAAAPTAVQFFLPYISGFEFSLQPATTPPGASNFLGGGGLEYFVSTASGSGNQVALWAMYNTISLSALHPAPVLLRTVVNTIPYYTPGAARQPPGPTPYGSSLTPPEPLEMLDGGDVRVQAVSYASGRLFVTFGSGVFDESGIRAVGGVYLVLSPTYRGGVLAGQVVSQGYLMVNGNDLLRPSIAVNGQGNGAIAVTLTGPEWFPSPALIPFQAGAAPSSIQVAARGALPEDGFTGYRADGGFGVARWGDYNTAVAASDGSIWMVTEYIGDYPRSEYANWNTYIYRKAR